MNRESYAIVLSGGGAKGAYQVGVLQALAEMDIHISAVSGASIGSLNGAIVASANDTKDAYQRLDQLWTTLGETNVLEVDSMGLIHLLAMIGLKKTAVGKLMDLGSSLFSKSPLLGSDFVAEKKRMLENASLLKDSPLQTLMEHYLLPEALAKGLPLYISLFHSYGLLEDFGMGIAGSFRWQEIFGVDTPKSEFMHVQSLPQEQQTSALLASAAIPLFFKTKELEGKCFADGGMGGMAKSQGNTPIQPLIDAGYKNIIVTHLNDASLWSRWDFPKDVHVLEIRPQEESFGGLMDMVRFDPVQISKLKQRGYADTLYCIGKALGFVKTFQKLEQHKRLLEVATQASEASDKLRDQAAMRWKSLLKTQG